MIIALFLPIYFIYFPILMLIMKLPKGYMAKINPILIVISIKFNYLNPKLCQRLLCPLQLLVGKDSSPRNYKYQLYLV